MGSPTPLAESPWFWAMLFCGAGLLGAMLIAPKFARRQAQLEQKYQGRTRAAQARQGQAPTTQMSQPESTHVRIGPVQWVLGAGLAIGWFAVWRNLRRRNAAMREQSSRSEAGDV